ncbi:hypothetical protein [Mesorhizobium sp. Z1-4]|uniref:hypothetical protein n=1 Tax=Mesorhizobium sp. Z1-4 TaxID=2448478 RepID=UPI000FD98A97|nr:hypothetical protein [Mesorhizobium sp. Z1-4]
MNLPAQQIQNLPLRRAATDDISRPLGKLVLAFDPYVDRSASHAKEYAQAKIAVYREALDGLPEWAIERAVNAFISGRAEGQNLDRFPTSARLAAEAQRHRDEEAMLQRARHRDAEQQRERRQHEEFLANRPPAEERARRAAEIMKRAGLQPMPGNEAE